MQRAWMRGATCALLTLAGASDAGAGAAAGDEIHGCVAGTGRLRIVALPEDCRTSEDPLTWKSAGETGEQGPEGPRGPEGPSGGRPHAVLVGFTAAAMTGGEGVFGFTRACADEFADSRMCTSEEVMDSASLPSVLTGSAWVRPVFVPPGPGGVTPLDVSGVDATSEELTCVFWSNGSSGNGLTVDNAGRFLERACNTPRRVACCAPLL